MWHVMSMVQEIGNEMNYVEGQREGGGCQQWVCIFFPATPGCVPLIGTSIRDVKEASVRLGWHQRCMFSTKVNDVGHCQ